MSRSQGGLTRDMETTANELATLAGRLESELASEEVDWHAVDAAFCDVRESFRTLESDHDALPWVVAP